MKVYAIHLGKGVRNMFDNLIDVQQKLSDKTVTVLGVGVSNLPLVTFLWENGIRNITLRDKNPSPEALALAQQYNLPLISAEEYLSDLNEDVIFRSPGIMPTKAELVDAINRGAILTSEMELFFDLCPAKIIGITGSDGKTTTTTLIYEILKKAGYTCHLGGNIGNPLLPELAQIKEDHIVIVELSSFQLMTMKKSADIAVITNLAPNHLDKHTDMAEYIDAKKNIYQFGATQTVFNLENDITKEFIEENSLSFSLQKPVKNGAYLQGDTVYFNGI
ncbi:MAG: UDP-N-acetylmuramoyl-L-alanine--D-glutamate ligase, partial [Peptococcaceae bacterium]|nr:UDP-N-acetylmuramoyl-L-alanine--D-glutamate ligase [Peptococcaceae bacterium]